jgi:hypothetical protein
MEFLSCLIPCIVFFMFNLPPSLFGWVFEIDEREPSLLAASCYWAGLCIQTTLQWSQPVNLPREFFAVTGTAIAALTPLLFGHVFRATLCLFFGIVTSIFSLGGGVNSVESFFRFGFEFFTGQFSPPKLIDFIRRPHP